MTLDRRTGKTASQIQTSPKNAVYVCLAKDVQYVKNLAKAMHCEDLLVVPPSWVQPDHMRGHRRSVVIDHAVAPGETLTTAQITALHEYNDHCAKVLWS